MILSAMAVAWWSMAPSRGGPFLFDDIPLIQNNRQVQDLERAGSWFLGGFWDTSAGTALTEQTATYWRPLTLASYAFDWWRGGGSASTFHTTNLVLHCLNTALLGLLLRRWLAHAGLATVAVLLFAAHPVQTESVAWISGRTDVLCLTGTLLCVLGVRLRARSHWGGIALACLGGILAFGSKEMAIVLPAFVAIELWSETRASLTGTSLRHLLERLAPWGAGSLCIAVGLRWFVHGGAAGAPSSPTLRVLVPLEALGRYVELVFWPHDLTLGRAQFVFDQGVLEPHKGFVALGATGLLVALFAAWKCRTEAPLVSLSWLAFLGTLLPVSQVVWSGYSLVVAPRFLYVPMTLATTAVVASAVALARSVQLRHRWLLVAALPVVCGLSIVSRSRSRHYESAYSYWTTELTSNPSFGPAQNYLVAHQLNAGRPRLALRLAQHFFTLPQEGNDDEKAWLLIHTVRAVMRATPDARVTSLRELSHFTTAMLEGRPGKLSIPFLGVRLSIYPSPSLASRLRGSRLLLQMVVAEIESRLGNDAAATQATKEVLESCSRCWPLTAQAALVAARARDWEQVERLRRTSEEIAPHDADRQLLTTIARARSVAGALASGSPVMLSQFYALTGAFGRAFEAARPAFDDPPASPMARAALAELAFRAGHLQAARSMLGAPLRGPLPEPLRSVQERVTWLDKPCEQELDCQWAMSQLDENAPPEQAQSKHTL